MPFLGGVVGYGETYEENVRRELEEEMGIRVAPSRDSDGRVEGAVRHCFSFHYKDERTNVWGDVWDCVWSGEIVPQPVSLLMMGTHTPCCEQTEAIRAFVLCL